MTIKLKSPWLKAVAGLLVWWLICWLTSGAWFDRQAQQSYQTQRLQAEQFVAQARPNFNRIIKARSGGPLSLARASSIRRALSQFADTPALPLNDEATRRAQWRAEPELIHASGVLKLTGGDMGLDSMLLLDANGYCVAASNSESTLSSIGSYFGEHEDFRAAQLGHSGTLASVDKNSGVTGLSFYAPVIEQGRFIGVVVGVNTLAPFIDLLSHANAFLTDNNGVVLLAHDPSLLFQTLPDAQLKTLNAATRQGLYQRTDFSALTLSSALDARFPELLSLGNREAPALLRSRSLADGKLSIQVLWPMTQLVELARLRLMSAAALGLIGSLALLLFILYTRRQREQHTMAQTLAQRDQHVSQASDFLTQIVNAIADPLVVKDHEHRWILVNDAFCKFMGQPREHFIGKTVHEIFPELQARRLWDTEDRVLSSGAESTNEEKLSDGLGSTHIVVIKNTPYTDTQGNRFIVGIVSDITERKQVERLLRAKEREFSSLAESLPVAVIRYDTECRRRYLNPTAERMLHGDSAELLGYAPDGKTIAASHLEIAHYRSAMEEVLVTNSPREIDFVFDELPAGEQQYYEVRFVPEHDSDGKASGVLAIWHDITERKHIADQLTQREQAFRSLAESSPDYIIRCDREARYRYLNDRMSSLLKLVSPLVAIGKRPSELFPDGRFDLVEQTILRVVESGQQESIELIIPIEGGVATYYQIVVVPESDVNQRIVGALAFGRDISSIRESEHKLAHFIDSLPGMAFTFSLSADECGRFPYVSSAIEAYFGLMPQDVKNDMAPIRAMTHPEDRPRLVAAMAEASRTLTPLHIESRICRPDLSERWVDVYSVPERQADGSLLWFGLMLDITARKRLELEMKQREAEFHALAENLPDPVFRYDRNCRRLYVNPAAMHITKMSKEQLLGHLPSDCSTVNPSSAEGVMAMIREVFASGERRKLQVEYFAGDGSSSDYEGWLVPEFAADGQVGSVLSMAHEVTNLRQAQRQAVSFFANMPGFAFTLRSTPDGRISLPFASPGIENIYGLRPEDVFEDAAAMHAMEHPEDQALIVAATIEAAQTLQPFKLEFRVQRPGQALRWIESRSTPERQADGSTVWHGVMLDITERKRVEGSLAIREQEFRSLSESSPDNIVRYDQAGRILYLNAAVLSQLGVSSDQGLIGKHASEVWLDDHSRVFEQVAARAVRSGHQQTVELAIPTRNDELQVHELVVVPERNAKGQVIGTLAFGRDITEHKRTEQQLQEALEFSQGIINALPDILFELDRDGRYLNAWTQNPDVQEAQKAALVGKTLCDMLTPASAELALQAIREADENGTAYGKALCNVQADGQVRWYEYSIAKKLGRDPANTTFLALSRDITTVRLAQERQDKSHDLLRALAAHQETVREKERKALAYQIHEDLAQNLAALRLNLSFLARHGQHIEQAPEFQTLHDITERSLTRVRDIVSVLRPTVLDLGLVPALEWLIDDFKGIGFVFDVALREDIALSDEAATLLFRASQEALLNVALHAGATHVGVSLGEINGRCCLKIRDNGCGFDTAAPYRVGRFGLVGLTEQTRHLGGSLVIHSQEGMGTKLTVFMPISSAPVNV